MYQLWFIWIIQSLSLARILWLGKVIRNTNVCLKIRDLVQFPLASFEIKRYLLWFRNPAKPRIQNMMWQKKRDKVYLVGWFQPNPKICQNLDHFPHIGVKTKNIWNHHLNTYHLVNNPISFTNFPPFSKNLILHMTPVFMRPGQLPKIGSPNSHIIQGYIFLHEWLILP